MALTEERIAELEGLGFRRWTRGNFDRLYINASDLGLVCYYYKSGNIRAAYINGSLTSNAEGYRMKAAKTFIDVGTGNLCSDNLRSMQAALDLLGMDSNVNTTDPITIK